MKRPAAPCAGRSGRRIPPGRRKLLADILAPAERSSADAVVWLPGHFVLAEPALLNRMAKPRASAFV